MTEEQPEAPVLRVVKGEPSDEELAALVAVVVARTANAGRPDEKTQGRSAWGDPARAVRPVLSPGPDGWRRSAFPR